MQLLVGTAFSPYPHMLLCMLLGVQRGRCTYYGYHGEQNQTERCFSAYNLNCCADRMCSLGWKMML